MRKLVRVDLLILDDFRLQAFDSTDTADIYELVVERHRAASTVVTSNREPIEWLELMADPLVAQSAIEFVLEGESYRHRQKPVVGIPKQRTASAETAPLAATHPNAIIPLRRSTTPGVSPITLAEGWSLTAGRRHSLVFF